MDFGRVALTPEIVLYLFGTPGQERFHFMWNELSRGAIGAVVLLAVYCVWVFFYLREREDTGVREARVPLPLAVKVLGQPGRGRPLRRSAGLWSPVSAVR